MPRQYKQIHFVLWKIYNIFSLKVVKLQLTAGFMLILDPENTSKWYCNKNPNGHVGCKNEQLADFEIQLENIITITRH